MQNFRLFLLLSAAPLLVPVASGCMFLKAPEPDPTPTPVATPKAPFFEPTAGQSRGAGISTSLNKAGDAVLPDAFRVTGATSGDRVTIQSVNSVTTGTPPKTVLTLGTSDPVRLAGIVAPTTEPALSLAKKTISDWTAGKDLDIEQDGRYPTDLNGVRVVHVFYKGRKGPYEGQVLSLNRMLVRSGNAVVDLYSPTAFDTSQWLLDEAYARRNRSGFWAFGTAIQQRIPLTPVAAKSTGTGAKSTVSIRPTTRAATTTTTSTTTTTQTTQTAPAGAPAAVPVAPPAPAAPAPAAPPSP